jgi:hypothetical protein
MLFFITIKKKLFTKMTKSEFELTDVTAVEGGGPRCRVVRVHILYLR